MERQTDNYEADRPSRFGEMTVNILFLSDSLTLETGSSKIVSCKDYSSSEIKYIYSNIMKSNKPLRITS
jgi:hypothetical protein